MSARACARCGEVREIRARELCAACHTITGRNGTLLDYPRRSLSREEFLEDFWMLHAEGYTRLQIAERLGVKKKALEKRLRRMGSPDLQGQAVAS